MPEARAEPAGDASGGPATTVAIVAGRGALPERLARLRAERGLPSVLVVFPGYDAAWMAGHSVQHHEFERAGALFRGLKAAGVTHLVFAGAMDRPRLRLWRADLTALRLALRSLALMRQGDDAMLRGFAAMFEARGFTLIGAGEILGSGATIGAGALGACRPGVTDFADARRAARIVAHLGELDIGQAAVVAGGLCLGIEALGGTDHLLASVAEIPAGRRAATAPPPSGVLYKAPKPDQDRRMDMPTIGAATVEAAARAGLAGIVVPAGEVQLLDEDATRAAADRLGLFVYGARPAELGR